MTRGGWVLVYLTASLALLSVLYARPLLLVGSAGIVAWLLAYTLDFRWRMDRTLATLTVEQDIGSREFDLGEKRTVSISATADPCYVSSITVRPTLPLGIRKRHEEPAELSPDSSQARATLEFEATRPGGYTIGPSRIELRDRYELFTVRREYGPATDVEVTDSPPEPHIGQSGAPRPLELPPDGVGFRNEIVGSELVKYHPGDDASQIDWKVTARMGDTYIRDDTSDQNEEPSLTVIVDGRASMFAGDGSESKLQYVRTVLDDLLELCRLDSVPTGAVVVTEQGLEMAHEPRVGGAHYDSIGQVVSSLADESGGAHGPRFGVDPTIGTSQRVVEGLFTGSNRSDSAFESKLRPFLRHHRTGSERVLSPLVDAVIEAAESSSGEKKAIVFTDDVHREEIEEAARTANQRGVTTDVYLLPNVAFDGLTGRVPEDEARRQFVRFETFRGSVSFQPHVRAFELCPQTWIEAAANGRSSLRSDSGGNTGASVERTNIGTS